jgi:hypothetical protein
MILPHFFGDRKKGKILTVITVQGVGEKWIFSSSSRSFGYGNEAV